MEVLLSNLYRCQQRCLLRAHLLFFIDLILHTNWIPNSVHLQILYHTYKVLMEMSGDSSTLVTIKGSTV